MAICPFPWFPVYAAELLSDEDFEAWSPAARGCWFTLSARCWKDGSIPADLPTLARLCGEDPNAMLEHWKRIGTKFPPSPGDPSRLISTRIERERDLAIERAERLTKRGQAGAAARWKNEDKVLRHHSSIALAGSK
jgi:hypothetical protein